MKSSLLPRFRPLIAAGCFLLVSHWAAAVQVVPGAVGFGTNTTTAGRGTSGTPAIVYKVTSPADPGYQQADLVQGTLRYGIEHSSMANKARVIVFETSGVIVLKRDLIVRANYGALTIAGQTAPFPGITLRNGGFIFQTGNVLLQHIAIRPGNFTTSDSSYLLSGLGNRDCFKIEVPAGGSASNIVIDHVSGTWSTDEAGSSYSENGPVSDITIQYSLLGKPIQNSGHPEPLHGFGPFIGDNSSNIAYIRNVMPFNWGRNPMIRSNATSAQMANNFVYRPGPWGTSAMYIGSAHPNFPNLPLTVSAVGNTIVRNGPFSFAGTNYNTVVNTGFNVHVDSSTATSTYLSGNRLYNPLTGIWHPTTIGSQYSSPFFSQNAANTVTPLAADPHANSGGVNWAAWPYTVVQAKLLSLAGKSSALRDAIDEDIFYEMKSGTGTYIDTMDPSTNPWAPVAAVNTRTFTTPANPQSDSDGDGYTLLEETLHNYAFEIQGDRRVSMLDTFEDGNSTGWYPESAASNWQVVTDGSHVLAQTDTSGDAQAFFAGTAFYEQVVEAKVKPVSFNGTNRFVRVYARYQDPQNAYYVTIRQPTGSTAVVELKKLAFGVVSSTVVDSDTITTTANAWYQIRLKVIPGVPGAATTLTATVTNLTSAQTVTLQTTDINPLPPGFAGVGTYFASARFDDVFASPNASEIPALLDDFADDNAAGWSVTNGTWSVDTTAKTYRQSNTATPLGTRSVVIAPNDQSIQVDVNPTSFAGSSSFVGVYSRYTDINNAYYVALRNDGSAELRKVVGGVVSSLSAPVAVDVGTGVWYLLKIEAVGTTIRGYVNGQLIGQATDTSLTSGSAGVGTYSATAQFDDVVVSGL